MDSNKKMMLMFRIKDQEIINLQNTLNFLSDRQQSLQIDEISQQNYKKFIDSAPTIVQMRNDLLQELENLAVQKYEESNCMDMTANLCLYLINKQRKAEALVSQLQNQFIESKFGNRFLKAELAKNDPIPENLEAMKPKYKTLKHDFDKIAKDIDEIQSVLQTTKKNIDSMRKSNLESERSVLETTRNMFYSVKEYDKQLSEISKKALKKQSDYNDKKSKYEKRINLINDITQFLKDEISEQSNTPAEKIVNELKLILENINGENQSPKFIKSRINILLKSIAIPKRQEVIKLTLQQPQQNPPNTNILKQNQTNHKQLLTPQAIKTTKPLFTPQQETNLIRFPNTPGATSQSIKDLKEKFKLLEHQSLPKPDFYCAPSVKSPK